MAASVHQALGLGGVGQIGFFLDRQRVHIRPQPDNPDVTLAGRPAALDDADNAGTAETRGDFVAAEFPQPFRHE